MLEGHYVSDLLKSLKSKLAGKHYALFKHSSYIQLGIPDISFTYNGMTTWWEAKVNEIIGTELQLYNMKMLASSGYARYIVFNEIQESIGIVHPQSIDPHGHFTLEAFWSTLDADVAADYILHVHND